MVHEPLGLGKGQSSTNGLTCHLRHYLGSVTEPYEYQTVTRWQSCSERPLPAENRGKRKEKYLHIHPQRPLLDILAIEPHHLLEIDQRAAAAHLPQPRYPWLGAETTEMVVLIRLQVFVEERPRTDERH